LRDLGVSKSQSHRWQKLSSLAQAEFEKRVAEVQQQAVKSVESSPEERSAEKKTRRAENEASIATQIKGLSTKKYGLITAEPEWDFVTRSEAAVKQIKARDVPSIAADDCALALWATVPMLEHALDVMSAWGFSYKAHIVWLKEKVSNGQWFRNAHGLLLIGVKGDVPAPAPGTRWEFAFDADVGKDGEKPEEAYELLESYFPNLPRIELNARKKRAGWDCWGAESPVDLGEAVAE